LRPKAPVVFGLLLAAGIVWLIVNASRPPEPLPSTTRDRGEKPDRAPSVPEVGIPGPAAEITGVVLGLDDRPFPRARVTLHGLNRPAAEEAGTAPLPSRILEALDYAAGMFERPLHIPSDAPSKTPPALAETDTDANGAFRFPVVLGLHYRAEASARGLFAGSSKTLRAGDRVVLRLAEGTNLRGIVENAADGKPVPGVDISADPGGAATITDERGSFSLGGLTPGPLTVRLRKDGFATRHLTMTLPDDGLTRTFRLGAGVTVTAVVEITDEDDDDHPAVGATVAFVEYVSGQIFTGLTDAAGEAVFEHLPPGAYDAAAHIEGAIPDVEWRLRISADRKVVFYLEKEVKSTIRVLGPDGRPVAGARFLLANVDEELDVRMSREVGRANDDGVFEFAFDEDARAVLWVTAPGLAAAFIEPDDPAEADDITVILRSGAALRGRVVDEEHRPIAGAVVLAESMRDDIDDEVISTVITGEDGTFRIDNLLRGEVDIEVMAEGYLPADDEIEELIPDGPRVEIVLRRGAEIHGRVIDATGAGVPGVLVKAPGASRDKATSDRDGSFRLGAIHRRAAAADIRLRLEMGTLVWSTQARLQDEVVVTVPASTTIRGRVVSGPGNAAVRDFTIEVRSPESGLLLRQAVTDTEGRFETVVPELPGVSLDVRARKRATWSRSLDEIPPSTRGDLTIVLDTPPQISVRVLTEAGLPVLGARVFVKSTRAGWSLQAVSGAGGVALIEGRPGEIVIEVSHRTYTGVRTPPILVEAGKGTVQEVRLGASSAARVRISGPEGSLINPRLRFSPRAVVSGQRERCVLGAPLEGGMLTVEFEGPGVTVLKYIRPRVDGDLLVVQGLPAGTYSVRAVLGSNRSAPITFRIAAGSTIPVEVVIGR
jgi:Carboxypeptidase regulatory-like domain